MMKQKWVEPRIDVQKFVPNEYIATCGELEDGTVLYSKDAVRVETAYNRTPAGTEAYVEDDEITNPHTIYMGSFYRDKEYQEPDSTQYGHVEQENYGKLECVRETDKSPWGYHYHFKEVTNRS